MRVKMGKLAFPNWDAWLRRPFGEPHRFIQFTVYLQSGIRVICVPWNASRSRGVG
ncbi:MAG: hypothetical protein AAGA25_09855 [Planctomycetota bacterium]